MLACAQVGGSSLMQKMFDTICVMGFGWLPGHGSRDSNRLHGVALAVLQFVRAPLPSEGVTLVAIPVPNEALDTVGLSTWRSKVPALENAAIQDRKPNLDLVHPRCMDGREHEAKPVPMARVEAGPSGVLAIVVGV